MSEIPEAAVQAAALAIERQCAEPKAIARDYAEIALAAALPHLDRKPSAMIYMEGPERVRYVPVYRPGGRHG